MQIITTKNCVTQNGILNAIVARDKVEVLVHEKAESDFF